MSALLSRSDIAVTVGLVCAIGLVLIARTFAARRELLVYGVGLGFTAVEYVALGLLGGAPAGYLGRELVGALLFGIAALLGSRRWPALLALGWTAHVVWDLFFHEIGSGFAPAWLPWFCVGFDLSIGGYIAGLIRVTPRGSTR